MNLDTWAQRHGITPQALAELRAIFTAQLTDPASVAGKSGGGYTSPGTARSESRGRQIVAE